MKLIKKASVVALSVLAMNVAQAEREYKETGSIQCYKDDTTTDKDTVILFVNGISNHLDDAESSRQKLSEVYGCQKCDFRKSYNQTDGFLDDTHELIYGSDLQNQAIKFAGIQALLKVYIRNTQTINLYQNQFQDEDKVIEVFGHKTTLKRLKEINLFVYNTIVQQQQTANKASFFYDPRRNGTDFDKALNDFINKISQPTAFAKSEFKAYHALSKSVIDKYSSILAKEFLFSYRNQLRSLYLSQNTFYQSDNTAKQAVHKSVESLQNHLNEYVLAGKKVIVVAHSQGNHIIELAYSKLQAEKGQNSPFMNAIRVVGVASVSSTTPHNSYITWDEDHTVLDVYNGISYISPLKANFKDANGIFGNWNDIGKDHSFEKVYLSNKVMGKYTIPTNIYDYSLHPSILKDPSIKSSSLDIIKGLLIGARASVKAMPTQITTNSLLTAQLRWEDFKDMDLHITEPDGKKVSFRHKNGDYGILDLDDTQYSKKPEHYFLNPNATCLSLSNKEWDFHVHQYPRGGQKAIVHFMLKLGDNRVMSRSFGKQKWSSSPVPIGKVTFEPYIAGSPTLNYTIKMFDSGD